MARQKLPPIEYRNYLLPAYFPIILLSGPSWRISDIPSGKFHFHNCLEIGLCESDSGVLQFSDSSVIFHEGDVTVIGSEIPHTTYSAKGTASLWSYLFVNIEELFFPYFPLEIISDGEYIRKMVSDIFACLPAGKYPEINMLVKAIIREMKQKEVNFQFSVRGLMLSLSMHFINLYRSGEAHTEKEAQENSISIAPALHYVRQNYMLDFPMEALASMCEMSPTHFRRTFSSVMGFGALEYLNRIRITHATTMLRTTELPILDISEEIGYQSVSNFNRHFMDIVGMTPMQYRKKMSCVRDQSVLRCTGWLEPEKF